MFDTVGEPGRADQVQRRSSMQTNPEQPIEARKVVHVGMRYKSMSNAQELARREWRQITEIEQKSATAKSEVNE